MSSKFPSLLEKDVQAYLISSACASEMDDAMSLTQRRAPRSYDMSDGWRFSSSCTEIDGGSLMGVKYRVAAVRGQFEVWACCRRRAIRVRHKEDRDLDKTKKPPRLVGYVLATLAVDLAKE